MEDDDESLLFVLTDDAHCWNKEASGDDDDEDELNDPIPFLDDSVIVKKLLDVVSIHFCFSDGCYL